MLIPYGHMTCGRLLQQKSPSLIILVSSQINPVSTNAKHTSAPSGRVTVHVSI